MKVFQNLPGSDWSRMNTAVERLTVRDSNLNEGVGLTTPATSAAGYIEGGKEQRNSPAPAATGGKSGF